MSSDIMVSGFSHTVGGSKSDSNFSEDHLATYITILNTDISVSQQLHFRNVFCRKLTQAARDVYCRIFCNTKNLQTIQMFFNKIGD